ncbi:MAG: hypothetical protein CVT94_15510 [Bacteroidetes bacterium HGW-Bacteroidetes-11]|jgi:hypothetical protein|nr:MAG: hypothetical protein CVT94_15510 [Bacteroidetes bacterium HGW-Bacteroidetes-11]
MSYTILEFDNFGKKIDELNCILPNSLTFLPENFDEVKSSNEFIYADSITDIKKIFRLKNIQTEFVNNSLPRYRAKRNADWFGPAFFISFSILTENDQLITLALNILSNYITDLFKGSFTAKKAKLEIIVEITKNKEFRKITYEGNPEGLKDLDKVIKSLK